MRAAQDLAALGARAVVCGLDELDLVPAGTAAYLTFGDAEARALVGTVPTALARAHAVVINDAEARLLTGARTTPDAAAALAESGASIVVTRGRLGAVGVIDG